MESEIPSLTPTHSRLATWTVRSALAALGGVTLWLVLDVVPNHRAQSFATWRAQQLERGVVVELVPEQVAHETRALGLIACISVLAVWVAAMGLRRLAFSRAVADPERVHEDARALARDVTHEALETARALAPRPAPEPTELASPPSQLPCEPLTQVVERLRDPWAPVRLGAIHSLRSIGETYPDWRGAVVDVLSAYVREHAALPEAVSPAARRSLLGGGILQRPLDAQTAGALDEPTLQQALTVLGALSRPDLDGPLNLSGLQLSGLSLEGARLEGARFQGSHVAGLTLTGARLQGADLSGVVGLDPDQLRGAQVDETTRLPQSSPPLN